MIKYKVQKIEHNQQSELTILARDYKDLFSQLKCYLLNSTGLICNVGPTDFLSQKSTRDYTTQFELIDCYNARIRTLEQNHFKIDNITFKILAQENENV